MTSLLPRVAPSLPLALSLLACLCMLSGCKPAAQPPPPTWTEECVDCSAVFDLPGDRFLQVDSSGRPHLVYGVNRLSYAWLNGTIWETEIIDPSRGAGGMASLAQDPAGRLHVAYLAQELSATGYQRRLRYAFRDAGGWHIEPLKPICTAGVSLAIEPSGKPHISCSSPERKLVWTHREIDGWHDLNLDTDVIPACETSLGVDSHGRAHVAYFRGPGNTCQGPAYLMYASVQGDSRFFRPVSETARTVSLAVSPDDGVHLAWIDNQQLVYGFWDGRNIQTALIDASTGNTKINEQRLSLALREGIPHVAYQETVDGVQQVVKMARRDAAGWQLSDMFVLGSGESALLSLAFAPVSTPPPAPYVPSPNDSIQVNVLAQGIGGAAPALASPAVPSAVHLAYLTWKGRLIGINYFYAHPNGAQHLPVEFFPAQVLSFQVAYDHRGMAHVAFSRSSPTEAEEPLTYLYRWENRWQEEDLSCEQSQGTAWKILMNGTDQVTMFYHDVTGPAMETFACPDGEKANIKHVEPGRRKEWVPGDVLMPGMQAIDSSGRIHIAYIQRDPTAIHVSRDSLVYAVKTGETWHNVWVRRVTEPGDGALVLTAEGSPRLAWWDAGKLYFARPTRNEKWDIQPIGKANPAWGQLSMALDRKSYAHLCYADGQKIKYVRQQPVGWHTEDLDDSLPGGGCSLSLDGNNVPHVAYVKIDPRQIGLLVYAYHDSKQWQRQLRSEGVSHAPVLTLEANSKPHILYYDALGSRLMHSFEAVPWINWRPPGTPILLPEWYPAREQEQVQNPPQGERLQMDLAWGNCSAPGELVIRIEGPAVFSTHNPSPNSTGGRQQISLTFGVQEAQIIEGSQDARIVVNQASGTLPIIVTTLPYAPPGETFTLTVTSGNITLKGHGAVPWKVHLPVIAFKIPQK